MSKEYKFIQWGDTHLGYFRYRATNEQGLNVRMLDIEKSFMQCVKIINERKPDFFLHAGDLFDKSHPSVRHIQIARRGMNKLKTPGTVISGTHDMPSSARETHPYKLLQDGNKNIEYVTEPKMVKLLDGVNVYHIPDHRDVEFLQSTLDKMILEPKDPSAINILVMHCDISGMIENIVTENMVKLPEDITTHFDYVALGHLHKPDALPIGFQRNDRVFFGGSTERLKIDKHGENRGIWEITISKDGIHREMIPLEVRPLFRLDIDIRGAMDGITALDNICEALDKEEHEDAIVIMDVKSALPLYQTLNIHKVKALAVKRRVLHMDIIGHFGETQKEIDALEEVDASNIVSSWHKFMKSKNIEESLLKKLVDRGDSALRSVLE